MIHAWHDVALGDSIETGFRDIAEISAHRLRELERFFLDYKTLEPKPVTVGDMRGRADAERAIRDAVVLYRERIKPTRGSDR